MLRWQAVIFDLDDTLYPEREYVMSGFQHVAMWGETNLGVPSSQGFDELKKLFECGIRGTIFNRWLASQGLEADGLVPHLVEVYRTHSPRIFPYLGIPEFLASFPSHVRLGLLSDGYLAVQQRKLQQLRLASFFDAICFSDALGREAWKPSLVPFKTILQDLEVDGVSAVYIGDNPIKDFLGARQAGISTIRLCIPGGEYGYHEPPTPTHAPDITVCSVEELARELRR